MFLPRLYTFITAFTLCGTATELARASGQLYQPSKQLQPHLGMQKYARNHLKPDAHK